MLIEKDIVILGGGIAGLWLLNRLLTEGFQAVLLESTALGHGQSIASQGMIHGGLKYALGGKLTGASEAIADMPEHWRRCLLGQGDVDLRGTDLLSGDYYMWPRESLLSRFNAFLGSKALRGKVDTVDPADYPDFFRSHIRGPLYRLRDIVLDVPSLLRSLGELAWPWIYRVDWSATTLLPDAANGIAALKLPNGDELRARRYICTSGEGAEFFLSALKQDKVGMQKRPLQMVVVKHDDAGTAPAPVYVHCVADQLSATPELTITTHLCRDGASAWYLGGELAEAGARRSQAKQLEYSKRKLARLFPWCDFSRSRFHSFHINRAEARQPDGKRPDSSSLLVGGNLLYCWPTKLTLAPNLATQVLEHLGQQALAPTPGDNLPLQGLEFPPLATTPWDDF